MQYFLAHHFQAENTPVRTFEIIKMTIDKKNLASSFVKVLLQGFANQPKRRSAGI